MFATDFSCDQPVPVKLDPQVISKEGSCTEIKCNVTESVYDHGAYWFWMKDAIYNTTIKDFIGTVVYSTSNSTRPVSEEFSHRVKFSGSPFSTWRSAKTGSPKNCNILICNLKKTDSGQYSFRYVGPNDNKWSTQRNSILTVEGMYDGQNTGRYTIV